MLRVLPAAFACLLDGLAGGLRHLAETTTPDVRMADFARFVVAAEPALPWGAGGFVTAYRRNRGQAIVALADGDLVATAVRKLIEPRDSWTGLVSDLYETLSMTMSPEVRRSADWPGNARWFADRLRRAAPTLRALGVDVVERRGGQGVNVKIRKIATLATLATSNGSRPDAGSDASVASDAKSDLLSGGPTEAPEPPAFEGRSETPATSEIPASSATAPVRDADWQEVVE